MNRRKVLVAAGAAIFSEWLLSQSLQAIPAQARSATALGNTDYAFRHVALSVLPWADHEDSIAEVAAVEVLRHGLSGRCWWTSVRRATNHPNKADFFPTLLDFVGKSPLVVSGHGRRFECARRSLQNAGFPSGIFTDNTYTDIDKLVSGHARWFAL